MKGGIYYGKKLRGLKKGFSILFAFATLCTGLWFSGQTVYASTTYTDTESNDSHEEAQLVSRNAQTASQAVSGSTSVYRYVTGTLSYDDEDWYKVYFIQMMKTIWI